MSANTEKWQCRNCRFLLGYVEDKVIVRIKRKDLYAEVHGGNKIVVNCCRCGLRNELCDDKIQLGEEVPINGL